MRAAVYGGPRVIDVREIPVPSLGPDDVLIEIDYCGICGTDLHFGLDGWGTPGEVGGHEYAGRIAALGSGVADWAVGDAVVAGPSPCGECVYCQAGRPSLCRVDRFEIGNETNPGAFAEYHRVNRAQLHRVPPGMPSRVAALTEPLAVAMHGITRGGVQPGMRVLVTGAGPIGQLTVAARRARGVEDVTVSEPSDARRAAAGRCGANTLVVPEDLVAPHMPMDTVDRPYDVALECSGRSSAMETALTQLVPAGTLVLVGSGMKPPRFDPNRILLQELTITGAYNYDPGGFGAALHLLDSGRLPLDELIHADDAPLEELVPAMEGLAAGTTTGKVMVTPR